MGVFEKKYGIKEGEKIKAFHKSRRLFCIYKDRLYIAAPNLPYSHATWFEKEGWITKEDDSLMNEIIRGVIDKENNIYFYIGYDFTINKEAEDKFFPYLKELVESLNLDTNAKIFGGLKKGKPNEQWPPRKEYGSIKNYL